MNGEIAIRARGLSKRFGAVEAVRGIDLDVRRGVCLAMLGPNGAGKTTTIEMLEGLTRPDAGSIEILGLSWAGDEREIRERIGVQLQSTKLQEKITVEETLRLFRSFYGRGKSVADALELVGLGEKARARIETLSGGQHQRLSLACALVSDPEILFLDEPTTGLDPQARRRVWEIVESFLAGGGTVLLTTHYMEEAERLAGDVVIVDAGRVIERGTPREVIARLGAIHIVELAFSDEVAAQAGAAALADMAESATMRRDGAVVELSLADASSKVGGFLERLETSSVPLASLQIHAPTLEDVFVARTGKHLRDG